MRTSVGCYVICILRTSSACSTFCRPFEYSGLTPCIVPNQHLSRNFCLRDTSAQGYVPDPPSLFSRTGGSGNETNVGAHPPSWPNQGNGPNSPDPFPPLEWGLGTRLGDINFTETMPQAYSSQVLISPKCTSWFVLSCRPLCFVGELQH